MDRDAAATDQAVEATGEAEAPRMDLGGAAPLVLTAAQVIRGRVQREGIENFRIHPKGTGVIVTSPKGLPANELIDEYLGEIYPPWRWQERQDAVAAAQRTLRTPQALPDFYNIVLERPSNDVKGYGLWYVDASARANMSSSLSHSCTPNCEPRMAVRNGKLVIILATLRDIAPGKLPKSVCLWLESIVLDPAFCGARRRGADLRLWSRDDVRN